MRSARTVAAEASEREQSRAEPLPGADNDALLSALAENAFEALAIHEAGSIVLANRAFCEMFSAARSDLVSRALEELLLSDDSQGLARVLEGEEHVSAEVTPLGRSDGFVAEARGRSLVHDDRRLKVLALRDVTERRRNDRALRHAQIHLEAAQAQAKLGSWEYSPESGRGHWSPEMFRLYDVDPAAGVPTLEAFEELVHPEDRQRLREYQRAALGGENGSVRYRTNPEHGPLRYLHGEARPVGFDGVRVTLVLGTVRDVTRFVEAERALKERQRRFRTLFDSAPIGIVLFTPQGRVVEFNNALLSSTGYGRQDVAGLSGVWTVFADRDEYREIRRSLHTGKEVHKRHVKLLRADSSTYDVSLSVKRVTLGGEPHILGMVEDISDRLAAERTLRASERRFRALIENGHEVCSLFSPTGAPQYVSPSIRNVLGWAPEQVLRKKAFDLVHPDDVESANAVFEEALAHPGKIVRDCHRLRHADGSYRVVEATGVSLMHDPAVGALVSNFRDVTEQRALEDMLRQAQKMEAIGQLTGGIAHDFNNLLSAVLVGSELMQMKIPPDLEELNADLRLIREAAVSGADLVKRLLAFGRQDTLQLEPLDVRDVCQGTATMLHRLLPSSVTIECNLGEDKQPAEADRVALQQIIVNLATNARDAMPDGGKLEIRVSSGTPDQRILAMRSVTPDDRYVCVEVSDTGAGMDEDVQRNIFNPFFTTKAVYQGTGLGMSMVYGLVKQQNGYVFVDSEVGKGTTVAVYLPSCDVARLLSKETRDTLGATADASPTPKGQTLLIVEDKRALRVLARESLEMAGYTTVSVTDGDEALSLIQEREQDFDLVLTDVSMARMNGDVLYRRARDAGSRVPFLFTSGYSDFTHKPIEAEDKAVAILKKPWEVAQLQSAVKGLLSQVKS